MHWHRRHSKTYVYTLRLMVFKLKFDQQTGWVFFNGGLESKTQFSEIMFYCSKSRVRSISCCRQDLAGGR